MSLTDHEFKKLRKYMGSDAVDVRLRCPGLVEQVETDRCGEVVDGLLFMTQKGQRIWASRQSDAE